MEVERGTGTAVFTVPHSFYGPRQLPDAAPTRARFVWPPPTPIRRRAPRVPFITVPRVVAAAPPYGPSVVTPEAVYDPSVVAAAASYSNGCFGAVPASEKAIAELPETTAGEARGKGCSVCMEVFGEGDALRRMQCCSHAFHEGCISMWLRASHLCPLCRFALPTQDKEDQERMGSAGG